jgi:indole-3-glycerol phosphate synthase
MTIAANRPEAVAAPGAAIRPATPRPPDAALEPRRRRGRDRRTAPGRRRARARVADATAASPTTRPSSRPLPGNAPRPIAERLAAPGLHLIAEVKRRSPSAGAIAADADPVALARAYEAGGASAISVLCEPHWFGGSVADLRAVRAAVTLPILAKEFVVDERQLPVLRSAGPTGPAPRLHPAGQEARPVRRTGPRARPRAAGRGPRRARAGGRAGHGRPLIGLNNRNLRTLKVDPEHCLRLRRSCPTTGWWSASRASASPGRWSAGGRSGSTLPSSARR